VVGAGVGVAVVGREVVGAAEVLGAAVVSPVDESAVVVELLPPVVGVPVEVDGLPVVVGSLPVVVDGLPVEVDGLPVEVDGLPVEVDGLPVVVDSLPVEVDGLPVVVDGLLVVDAGAGEIGHVVTGFSDKRLLHTVSHNVAPVLVFWHQAQVSVVWLARQSEQSVYVGHKVAFEQEV